MFTPTDISGTCAFLGIDPEEPAWRVTINNFRASHPTIDTGDPQACADLRDHLISVLATTSTQSATPESFTQTNGTVLSDALTDIFHRLVERISDDRGRTSGSATQDTRGHHGPRLADPDKFSGKDRSELTSFVARVRLKIASEPSKFPTEGSKIAYTISFLDGLAFQHYQPDILRGLDGVHAPAYFSSLDDFLTDLDRHFGDRQAEHAARRNIRTIQQGNQPAHVYLARFRQVARYLDWDDNALRDTFYHGLQGEIKDELARSELPDGFDALTALAIKFDQRLHERRQDRQSSTHHHPISSGVNRNNQQRIQHRGPTTTSSSSQTTVQTSLPAANAMEIDAIAGHKRLTDQEKKRRQSENLCLYCGKAGHYAAKCPSKTSSGFRPFQHRVSALQYTISTPETTGEDEGETQDQGNA